MLDQQRAFGIIVPTFQRGDGKTPFYLKRCIASIYAQTHQDFIIYLIGDDYIEQKEVEQIIEDIMVMGVWYMRIFRKRLRD